MVNQSGSVLSSYEKWLRSKHDSPNSIAVPQSKNKLAQNLSSVQNCGSRDEVENLNPNSFNYLRGLNAREAIPIDCSDVNEANCQIPSCAQYSEHDSSTAHLETAQQKARKWNNRVGKQGKISRRQSNNKSASGTLIIKQILSQSTDELSSKNLAKNILRLESGRHKSLNFHLKKFPKFYEQAGDLDAFDFDSYDPPKKRSTHILQKSLDMWNY